ncbi:hypothetical protein [Nocardia asiatica]|uniref:hypothetical protein n=1 Tax=Nocardia asiatica TaxID=209252 RepID=UPI003EE3C991
MRSLILVLMVVGGVVGAIAAVAFWYIADLPIDLYTGGNAPPQLQLSTTLVEARGIPDRWIVGLSCLLVGSGVGAAFGGILASAGWRLSRVSSRDST